MVKVFVGDTKSYLGKSLVPALVTDGHEVITWDEKQPTVAGALNFGSLATADVAILDVVRNPEQTEAVLKFLKDKELENDLIVIGVSNVMSWCRSKNSDDKPLHESAYKTRKTSLQYKPIKLLETLVLSAAKPRLSTFVICSGICYGAGEEEWKELFRIGWCCEKGAQLPLVGDGSNVIPMIHIADLAKVIATVVKEPPTHLQFIVATDNSRTTQKGLIEAINKGLGPGTPIQMFAKDDEKVLLGGTGAGVSTPTNAAATASAALTAAAAPAAAAIATSAGSAAAAAAGVPPVAALTAASSSSDAVGAGANAEIVLADMRFDTGPESDSYVSKLLESGSVMTWTAAEGLASVMDSVRTEFVRTRGLRPIRIAVYGPPGSGKTFYAEKLSAHYYLPHIRIGDVIKEVLERKDDPLSEEVAKALTPVVLDPKAAAKLKAKLLKQAQQKGLKGNKKLSALNAAVENQTPRLPLPLLTRLLKQKLRSSACRNKGFVLDGFPRNAAEARYLFGPDSLMDPDAPPYDPADDYEDDDPNAAADEEAAAQAAAEAAAVAAAAAAADGDGGTDVKASARSVSARPRGRRERKLKRDDTTMVQYVISLSCSEETARARFMKLDEKQIIPRHNDQDGFERRWAKWEDIHGPSEHKNRDLKPADSGPASGKKDSASDEKKTPAKDQKTGAAARAAAAAAATAAAAAAQKEKEREAAASAAALAAGHQFHEDGTPVTYPGETESAIENLKDVDCLDVGGTGVYEMSWGQAFHLMCVYVERGGKPFNYHPTPEEKRAAEAEASRIRNDAKEKADRDATTKQQNETKDRINKTRAHSERSIAVLNEDQKLVEELSVPLRKYLMANVIPALVDGLLDVCTKQPDDPVDHLAEFLFKHATGTREAVKFQDVPALAGLATAAGGGGGQSSGRIIPTNDRKSDYKSN